MAAGCGWVAYQVSGGRPLPRRPCEGAMHRAFPAVTSSLNLNIVLISVRAMPLHHRFGGERFAWTNAAIP